MVGSRLVKEEEKAVGGISKGAVWQYVQACGGPCVVLLLALAFLAFVCSQMFANVWLQHWVDQVGVLSFPLPRRARAVAQNMVVAIVVVNLKS